MRQKTNTMKPAQKRETTYQPKPLIQPNKKKRLREKK